MSKLIRHTQKRGTALFVALSLTALTVLSLVSFVGSPQSRDGGTPAETQVSAPVAGGGLPAVASAKAGDAGISSDQDQTQTAQPLTAADDTEKPCVLRPSLRRSCTNRAPRRYLIWLPAVPSQPRTASRLTKRRGRPSPPIARITRHFPTSISTASDSSRAKPWT